MRGRFLSILVVSMMICGVAVDRPVSAADSTFRVRKLDWTGQTPAAGRIEVVNPYGDIRLRPSESDDVVVSAMVQQLVEGQAEIDLAISEDSKATKIGLALPDDVEKYGGRVDITVLLPKGVGFFAQTTSGDVRIKSLRGRLEVRSDDGNVYASFKRLSKGENASVVSFDTGTGDIEVKFLEDTDVSIRAATGGEIRTEFPAELVTQIRRDDGSVTGQLGDGRSTVTVQSKSGAIYLAVSGTAEGSLTLKTGE